MQAEELQPAIAMNDPPGNYVETVLQHKRLKLSLLSLVSCPSNRTVVKTSVATQRLAATTTRYRPDFDPNYYSTLHDFATMAHATVHGGTTGTVWRGPWTFEV
jgi:hypothetical protein